MANKEHTFTIRFSGDSSNAILSMDEIEKKATELGVSVSKVFSSMSADGEHYSQTVKLAAKDLLALTQATAALGELKPGTRGGVQLSQSSSAAIEADNLKQLRASEKLYTQFVLEQIKQREAAEKASLKEVTAKTSQEYAVRKAQITAAIEEQEALLARRTANFNADTGKALSDLQNQLRLEQIARETHARSIEVFKEKQRQKEVAAETALQKKLNDIRTKFVAGDTNFISTQSARKKLLEDYATKVNKLRQETQNAVKEDIRQNELTKQQNEAIRAAKQKTLNAIKANEAAQNRVTAATDRTKSSIHRMVDANKSILRHVTDIVIQYRLVNSLINRAIAGIKSIPAAGIQQQQVQAGVAGVFGTIQGAKNLEFVHKTAEKFGQNLQTLEQGYVKFAPAAKLAGASQAQVNQIFEDFAAIGTVLHKTPDDMQAIFLAIEQMFAKVNVQSEEVKRQLGNQLPAVLEIFAKANEMSVADFMKAMKRNEIIAKDAVPKFTKLYRVIYGGEKDEILDSLSQKLYANYQRFLNRLTDLSRSLFDKLENALNTSLKVINKGLDFLLANMNGLIEAASILASLLAVRLAIAITSLGTRALKSAYEFLFFNAVLDKTTGNVLALEKVSLATSIGKLGGIITTAATRVLGFNLYVAGALAAITGLIAGIGALGGASLTYGKTVRANREDLEKLQEMYASNGKGAAAAGALLKELGSESKSFLVDFGTTQATIGEVIIAAWELVKATIPSIIDDIKTKVSEFTDWFEGSALYRLVVSGNPLFNQGLGFKEARQLGSGLSDISKLFFGVDITAAGTALVDGIDSINNDIADSFDSLGTTAKKGAKIVVDGVESQITKNRADRIRARLAELLRTLHEPYKGAGVGTENPILNVNNIKSNLQRILALFKQEADAIKQQNRVIQAELDDRYSRDILAYSEYFKAKQAIQEANYKAELEAINKSISASKQVGDLKKVADLQRERAKLEADYIISNISLNSQRIQAEERYQESLRTTQIELARLLGNERKAVELELQAPNKQVKELMAVYSSGGANANAAGDALKAIARVRQLKLLNVDINELAKKTTREKNRLKDVEERINREVELGIITQREGAYQLIGAREEYLNLFDKEIEYLQEVLALNSDNLSVVEKLEEVKREKRAFLGKTTGEAERQLNGGETSFISQFNQARANLQADRSTQLANIQSEAILAPLRDANTTQVELLQKQQAIEDRYRQASTANYLNYFSNIAGMANNAFESMTQAAIKMYGAQSKQAKRAFALQKAFALAQAAINTALGFTQALGQGGIVGIITGAIVLAAGAAQIAQIASQQMPAAAAHGGLDYVPKEQTYLLDKGERVLSPKQNTAITKAADKINSNSANQTSESKIRIINAIDPSLFNEFLGSDQGEKTVMNIVTRNQGAVYGV